MLKVTQEWKNAYPGAVVGTLAIDGVVNPTDCSALQSVKIELEEMLRKKYAASTRAELNIIPTVKAYLDYYEAFKKTYHVLLQLESLVFKNKSLPNVAALVEAMFMAELKNQVLTAGHDLEAIREPLTLDIARGDEQYVMLNAKAQVLKPNDMYIRDMEGIISCVIYGPDGRTRIQAKTRQALFVVYAPLGVGAALVEAHFLDLISNIHLIAPDAKVISQEIHTA